MSRIGVATEASVLANSAKLDTILEKLNDDTSKLNFGIRIHKTDSNPATRCEYLGDAQGMTPAYMDFSAGVFRMGTWSDVWFVKKNRPVMLKHDGTVDYELNHYDHSKKLDGTASDVSNVNYDGEAMSEMPTVWLSTYESGDYKYIWVANYQVDSSYDAYAHTDEDGNVQDFLYLAMYGGSLDSSNHLRSLSGKALMQSKTAEQEIAYATANGDNWFTKTWAQCRLVQCLLTLMFCNTNSQAVLGNGNLNYQSSGTNYGMLNTGTLDTAGQFFGYNDNTHQVKAFYCEKPWGDQNDRIAGMINDNGTIKVKMTAPYPKTGLTTAATFSDFISIGTAAPSGTSGGYISSTTMTKYGDIPTVVSGSETTYECDGLWYNNSQLDYALVGGYCSSSSHCGLFCLVLHIAASDVLWFVGASLSFLPRTQAA